MPLQYAVLTISNAMLVGLLAIPIWLAWRYFQHPALKHLMAGYVAAAIMYGSAPYAHGLVFPQTNLAVAIMAPIFGVCFIACALALLDLPSTTRRRWTLIASVGLIGSCVASLPFKAPLAFPALLLALAFAAIGSLCWVHSRREPQVGIGLVALSFFSFTAVLMLFVRTSVPEGLLLELTELPFVALGLSVLTVFLLRTRKKGDVTAAQVLAMEMELSALSKRVAQESSTRDQGADGASRLVEGFNRTVAHDLKGGISAILAGAQFTRQMLQQGEVDKAIDFLPKVESEANLTLERISALQRLAQSHSYPLDLREVSLETVAKSALSEVTRQQPGQKLATPVYLLPLPVVVCDPGLMRVMFINLLSNAVKHSAKVDNATVHIGTLQDDPNEEPVYFIRDTGEGFDPAKAPELFTPFGRRDPSKSGSGVGVPIAVTIIERHGGKLWVESDIGQGATFFFTLGKLVPTKPSAIFNGAASKAST